MLLLFIGCVMIPIGILFSQYYKQVQKSIKDSMEDKMQTSLDEISDVIQRDFSSLITLARTSTRSEKIYQFFDRTYERAGDYISVFQEQIQPLFKEKRPYYEQVSGYFIYTDNPTVFDGGCVYRVNPVDMKDADAFYRYLQKDLSDVHMYKLEKNEQTIFIRYANKPSKIAYIDNCSISLFYCLDYYPFYSTYHKWIRIDMNLDLIRSQLNTTSLFDYYLMTYRNGDTIVKSTSLSKYKTFDENTKIEGVVIMKKELEDLPFIIYEMYDVNAILSHTKEAIIKSLPLVIICLLLAVIFMCVIMGNISHRISQLVAQSKKIAGGDFTQNFINDIGKDEISSLEKSMNQMSMQLKDLIETKYQAQVTKSRLEKETTQAKLLALQSQVNPHFMFNAIESIRLKAATKGEAETAKMLKYMSRMFRQLITWEESIIYLRDEIKFLDEFLHIQEYRFEDEFSYEIQVDENTKECLIPKMMVQQLVENACVHGVEAITNDRFVAVTTRIIEDKLEIVVRDNGGGMSEEKLKSVLSDIKKTNQPVKGVGLTNIYNRLRLYYGDEFEFQISSELHVGTTCEIRIPVNFKVK